MLAGAALLTCNDALIKSLAGRYPVGELLFFRGFFVWPWIFLIAWRLGGLRTLRINSVRGQALRSLCVIASSFLFVTGLKYLTLTDAIAVAFSGPLFITAMAPVMLGETVGWRRWMAVTIGFAGVICMLRPGSGTLQWAVLLPLGAAICGGLRDIITRRISGTETTVAVLGVTTGVVMLAGIATIPFGWVPIRPADLPTFALSGVLIACAHYLVIEAFRRGEAAMVAPFKYSSLIWAVLIGFVAFGELPDLWTLIGGAIIISAGLYVLHREARLKRRAVPVTATGPSARL